MSPNETSYLSCPMTRLSILSYGLSTWCPKREWDYQPGSPILILGVLRLDRVPPANSTHRLISFLKTHLRLSTSPPVFRTISYNNDIIGTTLHNLVSCWASWKVSVLSHEGQGSLMGATSHHNIDMNPEKGSPLIGTCDHAIFLSVTISCRQEQHGSTQPTLFQTCRLLLVIASQPDSNGGNHHRCRSIC